MELLYAGFNEVLPILLYCSLDIEIDSTHKLRLYIFEIIVFDTIPGLIDHRLYILKIGHVGQVELF